MEEGSGENSSSKSPREGPRDPVGTTSKKQKSQHLGDDGRDLTLFEEMSALHMSYIVLNNTVELVDKFYSASEIVTALTANDFEFPKWFEVDFLQLALNSHCLPANKYFMAMYGQGFERTRFRQTHSDIENNVFASNVLGERIIKIRLPVYDSVLHKCPILGDLKQVFLTESTGKTSPFQTYEEIAAFYFSDVLRSDYSTQMSLKKEELLREDLSYKNSQLESDLKDDQHVILVLRQASKKFITDMERKQKTWLNDTGALIMTEIDNLYKHWNKTGKLLNDSIYVLFFQI